jgi:ribosomal protein S7
MTIVQNQFKYFSTLDGVYNSYWVGKLVSLFIQQGKKLRANKQVMVALLNIKLFYNSHPALYLFEILEQARPIFQLKNCFPRKTKIIYPALIIRNRQYMIALHWLKNEIRESQHNNSQLLIKLIFSKLVEIHTAKKHMLFKRRDYYLGEAVLLQDNSRFSWSRV